MEREGRKNGRKEGLWKGRKKRELEREIYMNIIYMNLIHLNEYDSEWPRPVDSGEGFRSDQKIQLALTCLLVFNLIRS